MTTPLRAPISFGRACFRDRRSHPARDLEHAFAEPSVGWVGVESWVPRLRNSNPGQRERDLEARDGQYVGERMRHDARYGRHEIGARGGYQRSEGRRDGRDHFAGEPEVFQCFVDGACEASATRDAEMLE